MAYCLPTVTVADGCTAEVQLHAEIMQLRLQKEEVIIYMIFFTGNYR